MKKTNFLANRKSLNDFIVNILFSLTRNRFYIGFTSILEEIVIRHNQKGKGFTGDVNDWEIVSTEIILQK